MWYLLAGYISRFVGPSYQIIAFLILQSGFLIGYFYEKWSVSDAFKNSKGMILTYYPCMVDITSYN